MIFQELFLRLFPPECFLWRVVLLPAGRNKFPHVALPCSLRGRSLANKLQLVPLMLLRSGSLPVDQTGAKFIASASCLMTNCTFSALIWCGKRWNTINFQAGAFLVPQGGLGGLWLLGYAQKYPETPAAANLMCYTFQESGITSSGGLKMKATALIHCKNRPVVWTEFKLNVC